MRKIIIMICIISIILICNSVQGVPPIPPHMSNPSPTCGERNVTITAKGVQTCLNITVDAGCTVNISFLWWNTSMGDWGDWDLYGEYLNVSSTGQFCAYDNNVSCATENDEFTWWHLWRVVANFTCQSGDLQEIFYCWYTPEVCSLFYIYPPNNGTEICPCSDGMCIGITNENGNLMNLTFYRNDTMNETFYAINKYINVTNGTYCFCIDGHIADIYYPMKFNETYHWYVNITDTVTGSYNISNIYWFTTAENLSDCICLNASACDDCGLLNMSGIVGLIGLFGILGYFLVKRKWRHM